MLARAHVVAAHVAARRFLVGHPLVRGDVLHERTDDDDAPHDDRGRVPVEVGERAQQPGAQVDLALLPEVGVALAGAGVQRDQPRTEGGHDARRLPVGPVGDAASLAHPHAVARPRVPEHLTRLRVERRDRAEARTEVEPSVDHERSGLRADRPAGGVAVPDGVGDDRLPPDDLDPADRLRVDLVERRVLGARLVRGVGRPLRRLGVGRAGWPQRQGEHAGRQAAGTDSAGHVPHLDLLVRPANRGSLHARVRSRGTAARCDKPLAPRAGRRCTLAAISTHLGVGSTSCPCGCRSTQTRMYYRGDGPRRSRTAPTARSTRLDADQGVPPR